MNTKNFKRIIGGQFDATIAMLEECVRNCPPKHWRGIIGKYPFWQVAYHTLYCTDLYTARSDESWKPHAKFHPTGRAEIEGEYPSRMFMKREILAYLKYCSKKVRTSLKRETESTLDGPAGFPWLKKMTRAELLIYNLRHVAHHSGQLGAFLRRKRVKTKWAKSGGK